MFTEMILDKLGLFYDDIAKKKHGSARAFSYGEILDRILAVKGAYPTKDAFPEIGEQTFNRMMRNIFPEVRLNGGTQTWFFHILAIIDHKYCGHCKEIKSFSEFSKDKSNSSIGLSSTCKDCTNIEQRGQYKKYFDSHQRSYERNYGKIRERQNHYKSERNLRIPPWSQTEVIADYYANCPEGMHVDHIIPLKGRLVSGLHVIENLQYITARENISKGNTFIIN